QATCTDCVPSGDKAHDGVAVLPGAVEDRQLQQRKTGRTRRSGTLALHCRNVFRWVEWDGSLTTNSRRKTESTPVPIFIRKIRTTARSSRACILAIANRFRAPANGSRATIRTGPTRSRLSP